MNKSVVKTRLSVLIAGILLTLVGVSLVIATLTIDNFKNDHRLPDGRIEYRTDPDPLFAGIFIGFIGIFITTTGIQTGRNEQEDAPPGWGRVIAVVIGILLIFAGMAGAAGAYVFVRLGYNTTENLNPQSDWEKQPVFFAQEGTYHEFGFTLKPVSSGNPEYDIVLGFPVAGPEYLGWRVSLTVKVESAEYNATFIRFENRSANEFGASFENGDMYIIVLAHLNYTHDILYPVTVGIIYYNTSGIPGANGVLGFKPTSVSGNTDEDMTPLIWVGEHVVYLFPGFLIAITGDIIKGIGIGLRRSKSKQQSISDKEGKASEEPKSPKFNKISSLISMFIFILMTLTLIIALISGKWNVRNSSGEIVDIEGTSHAKAMYGCIGFDILMCSAGIIFSILFFFNRAGIGNLFLVAFFSTADFISYFIYLNYYYPYWDAGITATPTLLVYAMSPIWIVDVIIILLFVNYIRTLRKKSESAVDEKKEEKNKEEVTGEKERKALEGEGDSDKKDEGKTGGDKEQ
ncbi:MAG: hypothetical protein QW728_00175 [Thermoplasmata archaeon]